MFSGRARDIRSIWNIASSSTFLLIERVIFCMLETMKTQIHSYRWQPPAAAPKRDSGVYLLHGTGEHAGRYAELVTLLTQAGWHVGAHDHPGHGQSSGKRGLIDPPDALVTQAAIQIQNFAKETGAAPIVFGHILGGVIATDLVLQHGLNVRGLVLSAPALFPLTGTLDRIKLWLLTRIAPKLCLDLGYNPNRLTHDEQIKVLAHADPLIHSFKSATLVNGIIQSGRRSFERASNLSTPTLLMLAGDDLVVDSNKSREFADRASSDYMTLIEYDGFYHELLNETQPRRERVLADIKQWLEAFT